MRKLDFPAIVLASLLLAQPSTGRAAAGLSCQTAKLATAGRMLRDLLRCEGAAATVGTAIAASCVDAARASLAEQFQKLEAQGHCVAGNDAASIESEIESIESGGISLRPFVNASACAGEKLVASAAYASRIALAVARDKRKPDDVALNRATSAAALTLRRAFQRAERRGRGLCFTANDWPSVESIIDAGLTKITAELFPPPPPVCGDGVVEQGESCDGATCPNPLDGDGASGCYPPGDPQQCQCCPVVNEICYDQFLGLTFSCCPGMGLTCLIPPRFYTPYGHGFCAPSCTQQSECAPGYACIDGGCLGPLTSCAQQSDCPTYNTCIPALGLCIPCDWLGNCP
jgi:hypothetical protein